MAQTDPDLEQRRLDLEERRVKVEERKAEQGFWTRVGIVVPILVGLLAFAGTLLGTWYTQHVETNNKHQESLDKIDLQERQANDAFELKVVELVMNAEGPAGTRNRAKAIKLLFPDHFDPGFADNFNAEQVSDREAFERDQRVAAKKELLKLLVEHPDNRSQILATWQQLFPKDEWAKQIP